MLSRKPWAKSFAVSILWGVLIACVCLSGCADRRGAREWSPHYRRAVEAYRRGDYPTALSLFQKALLYEPSNAEILLDVAAIYDDLLGDTPRAISFYEKYLKLSSEGQKAQWVRRWLNNAKQRLASGQKPQESEPPKLEAGDDKDKLIETLREEVRVAKQSLAEEREKTKNLSERITALNGQLSAALRERQELRDRLAGHPGREAVSVGEKESRGDLPGDQKSPIWQRRWVTASWLVCISLGFVVLALIFRQRYASAKQRALLAGIQASASGAGEQIRKEDIVGKYFWVENDRNAGVLNFTEKDGEIHVCAIDGTTRLRSRGKGRLSGNVLTAELHATAGESVATKFIFANKGRTLTAVWQGEEGVSVAAGTKAVHD